VKILSLIQPRYAIAITFGVAVIMFVSAFVELQQSKSELFHMLNEQSVTLTETIDQSSKNIVLATEYIERQLSDRLLNNAYYIARIDSAGVLTSSDLAELADANSIFRIHLFNRKGKRILSSHPPLGFGAGVQAPSYRLFDPILRGDTDRVVIGFRESRFKTGERFAVAVKRTHRAGGVIVLTLDARDITEFRKNIGIGRLIRDLGNNSGIEYIALQDEEGIIAATAGISEMSRIEDDPELKNALHIDSVLTRRTMYGDREVFEAIRTLTIDESIVGVMRIGISMEEIRSVEQRMWRRMVIMTIVLIAIGTVIFTAISVNQNYHLLSRKYERERIFTKNILHHMQDIVVTLDESRRVTIFNQRAEEFFGIPASTIIDRKIDEIPDGLRPILHRLFDAGNVLPEQTIVLPDSKEYVVMVSVTTTLKQDGTPESRTLIMKDLTEAKRLEREIQRKEKLTAMGELASGVAHEIRNPLNAISMIAQRYEKEFTPKKNVKEYNALTRVLKKEAVRVNKIIQQFLLFARPPKIRLEKKPAKEFARHLSVLFAPLAADKRIVFRSTADDSMLFIDEEQMTQALLNLLQNSLDATPEKGEIRLTIKKAGSSIQLEVSDTGSGIPADERERIFDLYYTTKSGGTGLGLGITHRIISQHGGTIELNSKVGKGSSMIITIPSV
jgi:two-component system sensor histidine kinase HydH